jgi:Domain of Unknown Function (DUF1206)
MTTVGQMEQSTGARAGARVGLAARGVIYLLVGILAASLAIRGRGQHADQKGAVTDLASQPFGAVLVWVIALGLAAYALWQLSQVFTGVVGEEDSAGKRVRALVSAIVYAGLTVSSFAVLAGAHKSQSDQQSGVTAKVMQHNGGRWLVAVVGLVVVGVGIALVVQGVKASFMKRFEGLTGSTRDVVRRLGQVGTAARGVVFGLAGVLVVSAAWSFDPQRARGIDGALRTLLEQPYGRALTGLAALGLMAFGAFGLAEAKYRKVR